MRTRQAATILSGFLLLGAHAAAQTVPLEIRQSETSYNLLPNLQSRDPAVLPADATPGQFKGAISFGGGAPLSSSAVAGGATNSQGNVIVQLKSSSAGAPYVSQRVAFLFGSVIPAPDTDENGAELPSGTLKENYWFAEPYSADGQHTGAAYYWSKHKRAVFAKQAGPVAVTWKKRSPLGSTQPSDYGTAPEKYSFENGLYYRLYTTTYAVSGSPAKPPRKIFWTEQTFVSLGKPVQIPQGRVGVVNVIYTDAFPVNVVETYHALGEPVQGAAGYEEKKTLWVEQGQMRAYNVEGRVLVELLGDPKGDGTREPLGYEIVDVLQQPSAEDVTVELGDRMKAFADGTDDSALIPDPLVSARTFCYQHGTQEQPVFYATRETRNLNDALVYWLEEGEVGLRWPARLVRYKEVWPSDPARYSHYTRPAAATDAEAIQSAVKLPSVNTPLIEYQDVFDFERAKLTTDSRFYTILDAAHPAHRTLLRFNSGPNVSFERVFSWLNSALKSNQDRLAQANPSGPGPWQGTATSSLSVWDGTKQVLNWQDLADAPRVVDAIVEVGRRIKAPSGERGAGASEPYLAGYIRQEQGTSFDVEAYVDPFGAAGAVANQGAIIPVNAIPSKNKLEVWWFRQDSLDVTKGFSPVLWPAVVGRYTIRWPSASDEIILASNQGSGPLESLQATGSIYYQNDPAAPGYNPNEEHALMLGGQAWALRDDLNITTGSRYSSDPYVLLSYTDADGRPSMHVFHVLREKPSEGIVFDYLVEAGTKLQAPMPLPLLPKPVVGQGTVAYTLNAEADPSTDVPSGWDAANDPNGPYGPYDRFTYRDRKKDLWVYRGVHAGPPPLAVGTYDTATTTFQSPTSGTAVAGQDFSYVLHTSRLPGSLRVEPASGTSLPAWLRINNVTLAGAPAAGDVGAVTLSLVVTANDDGSQVTVPLSIQVVAAGGTVQAQDDLEITWTSAAFGQVTMVGRPPYLAVAPTSANSFSMHFYYKTQEGFAWPGMTSPPPTDSIVPYLRPKAQAPASGYTGDAASSSTASLDIVYRPYWPYDSDRLPRFDLSDTLTAPKNGLPAVRGQTSTRIVYQQSIALNFSEKRPSVVLHDPTREKISDLEAERLDKVPPSIKTSFYQGKYYFPALPPHLAQRFFFDPNRGTKGQLVFKGEFKDEPVGEKYLLLNVLSHSETDALKALCPTGVDGKNEWDHAIEDLATTVDIFREVLAPDPQNAGGVVGTGVFQVDPSLGQVVGATELASITDSDAAVDSYALSAAGPGTGYVTLIVGDGSAFTPVGDPVSMYIIKVEPHLHLGEVKIIPAANPLSELITFQHSPDLAARFDEFEYDWRLGAPVDGLPPRVIGNPTMAGWTQVDSGTDRPRYTLGGSGVQTLGDNYVVVRYRPKNPNHPLYDQWSDWTEPQLAEGWIKRVLAGINPFNQRITDLFNNQVNTDASMLTQAGKRWEGDIPLNLANINDYGLIEIYETVLRRGRSLSIDAGINFGPANDALLLATGYLNDLYMVAGNEAWADAANPTIGIGTKDRTYGDIATALFAFKGQVPSLLEEELALLRGRDDFLQPGVTTAPVYNRLFWNYTRGIDAGEVIYALNYNIQEDPNGPGADGAVNADDARRMFPQGHGDAYGHYLTAVQGYYSLLLDTNFDWVPRTEAVTVLGKPVQVDYQDERKFAAASAALARAGRQVFDLTWRRDYQSVAGTGWDHLSATRTNDRRAPATTRYWGLDHWASRAAQGAYFNWVVGNAILPEVDPNPNHEGIQKIDRTTVPELAELTTLVSGIQTDLETAEGGLNPLGMPESAIPFDLNPLSVANGTQTSHFEQIYQRASGALDNATAAFDDAKDVTSLMRSEQDSLNDLQAEVAQQELAYQNSLIELYGTPYTDDIGPGKTYAQGYAGPDLIHFAYVDLPEIVFPGLWNYLESSTNSTDFVIDLQDLPSDWVSNLYDNFDFLTKQDADEYEGLNRPTPESGQTFTIHLGPHGYAEKPSNWTGKRASPGRIQQAISDLIAAHRRLKLALYNNNGGKADFDKHLRLVEAQAQTLADTTTLNNDILDLEEEIADLEATYEQQSKGIELGNDLADLIKETLLQDLPDSSIFGVAFGGDTMFPVRIGIMSAYLAGKVAFMTSDMALFAVNQSDLNDKRESILEKAKSIATKEQSQALKDAVYDLFKEFEDLQAALDGINVALRELDDAGRQIRALIAQGDRIQAERETYRRRSAALVQGFRTRDAAFRSFRSEKLERYKALFELAARYAFLAANAYDYETGLLHTQQGKDFINRIIQARALGVMRDGKPQYAGSNTGDPGLSSAMAEMKADWDVLQGRLGIKNPDAYGTTVSLRSENFRILPGTDGNTAWRDVLNRGRKDNLLSDPDVRRYCMQINSGNGLPIPGIVIEFGTTIADGVNLFGQMLAAGDHAFSPTSFATKIFAMGVALEGYKGMDDPNANGTAVADAGAASPADPDLSFLDPQAMAATPYIYLIPVGVDSMRSPPLGDVSQTRTWTVDDVSIPLPFNIGGSDFSTTKLYQSSDSLQEPLFAIRKHQAFRPVSSANVFGTLVVYWTGGELERSQYLNTRLIGRSAWNSKWKLIIPGRTLLNNPNDGLDRFVNSITDIKLFFHTYSYSGN